MHNSTIDFALHHNVPLQRYNSWHVGGKASKLFQPSSPDDLMRYLKQHQGETFTWLGLGSNVLIADQGVEGTVIHTLKGLSDIQLIAPRVVRAFAGTPCSKLAKFAASQNLGDLSFMAGIPGTVGGALAMNAGCYGAETWDQIVAVETLDAHGVRRLRAPSDFEIGYRCVLRPENEWFLAGIFNLTPTDQALLQDKIKQLLKRRNAAQPIGTFSGGSVFQNPPNHYAGALIEGCGLKGTKEGGATISEKHANFIINQGDAKAADIKNLIMLAKDAVVRKYGIDMHTEVKWLGPGGWDA